MDYFVRCEFYPQDNNDMGDADKYELRVDENFTPEWFEEFRESVTNKMRTIIKNMIVTGDRDCLIGGAYILKNAKVGFLNYCRIVWASNSTVNEMRDNSTVNKMLDNSTVNKMLDNSTVNEMWDNSTVKEMWDNSTVKEMWDNSTVKEMWGNSTVKEMWDNSTVNEMRDNSTVNQMRDNSTVNQVWDNSTVNEMWDRHDYLCGKYRSDGGNTYLFHS